MNSSSMNTPGFRAHLNSVVLHVLEEIVEPDDVRKILDLSGLPNLSADYRWADGQRPIYAEDCSTCP
ncbi:MAG: hypothetical protein ACUVRJ_01595 [Candidatus Villigracilaceae bacterium]